MVLNSNAAVSYLTAAKIILGLSVSTIPGPLAGHTSQGQATSWSCQPAPMVTALAHGPPDLPWGSKAPPKPRAGNNPSPKSGVLGLSGTLTGPRQVLPLTETFTS